MNRENIQPNRTTTTKDQYQMGVFPRAQDSILDMSFPIAKAIICSLAVTKYGANTLIQKIACEQASTSLSSHIHNNPYSSNLCSRKVD